MWLCGSVGRVVASDTRGLQFKSSHWQNLLNICLLSTVLKDEKMEEKEAGNGPLKNRIKCYMIVNYDSWVVLTRNLESLRHCYHNLQSQGCYVIYFFHLKIFVAGETLFSKFTITGQLFNFHLKIFNKAQNRHC